MSDKSAESTQSYYPPHEKRDCEHKETTPSFFVWGIAVKNHLCTEATEMHQTVIAYFQYAAFVSVRTPHKNRGCQIPRPDTLHVASPRNRPLTPSPIPLQRYKLFLSHFPQLSPTYANLPIFTDIFLNLPQPAKERMPANRASIQFSNLTSPPAVSW